MKKQDKAKYQNSTPTELKTLLTKLSGELVEKQQELKLGRSKNTKQGWRLRRQIAVVKTILREMELNKQEKVNTEVKSKNKERDELLRASRQLKK